MKRASRSIAKALLLLSVIGYSAVCYHSVQEIHYLKTFFPGTFTVEEAYYASYIELIKILIIGIPVLLVIILCIIIIKSKNSE